MTVAFGNPITLVKTFKGSAISIIFAMMIVKQPVTEQWLCSITGYSDKTVKEGLILLKESQFIYRVKGGWMLGDNAKSFQLPFFIDSGENNKDENIKVRKNSELSITTTTLINRYKQKNMSEEVVVDIKSRKNSELFEENLRYLQIIGIYEPTASRLAELEWVNPYYLIAQFMRFDQEKKYQDEKWRNGSKLTTGMLVYRIQNNDPVPGQADFYYGTDEDGYLFNVSIENKKINYYSIEIIKKHGEYFDGCRKVGDYEDREWIESSFEKLNPEFKLIDIEYKKYADSRSAYYQIDLENYKIKLNENHY